MLALLGCVAWYVTGRDWRAGAVLLTYAAGWLPWFYYAIAQNRTMYLFYMIPPGAVHGAGRHAHGRTPARQGRRAAAAEGRRGGGRGGAFALIVLINFWWLHPVLSAETLTRAEWWDRMLMTSWVTPAPK
ncbi:hypothetical protein ACFSTC_04195 [Nonomuraea ferruginea]